MASWTSSRVPAREVPRSDVAVDRASGPRTRRRRRAPRRRRSSVELAQARLGLLEAGLVRRVELLVVGAERGVGDLDGGCDSAVIGGLVRAGACGRSGARVGHVAATLLRIGRGPGRWHGAVPTAGRPGLPARAEASAERITNPPMPPLAAALAPGSSPPRASGPPPAGPRPPRPTTRRATGASTRMPRWSRRSRRSPPPTLDRADVLDRPERPGPRALAAKVPTTSHRRGRARGLHRRPDPRQRADEPRDDDPDPALARRGLRLRQPGHGDRRTRARSGSCSP